VLGGNGKVVEKRKAAEASSSSPPNSNSNNLISDQIAQDLITLSLNRIKIFTDQFQKKLNEEGLRFFNSVISNPDNSFHAKRYKDIFTTEQLKQIQEQFNRGIDDPHHPDWHPYSIQEHTTKVFEVFSEWVLGKGAFAKQIQINPKVSNDLKSYMVSTIGDKTRLELLAVAIVFHDLGKYLPTVRFKNGELESMPKNLGSLKQKEDLLFSHKGHEAISGDMIKDSSNFFGKSLVENGFSKEQIKYIADLARIHFEFGHVRNDAKETSLGYNMDFVTNQDLVSRSFTSLFTEASNKELNKKYPLEVGLLFLLDSLGKVPMLPESIYTSQAIQSQEELDALKPQILKYMNDHHEAPKGGDKDFFSTFQMGIMQLPINIALSLSYFDFLVQQDLKRKTNNESS
jgi:hypothetical protein